MLLVFTIFATGNWAAIGAALAVGVLLGGPVSGGSFNPAVTISLYSAGKLSQSDVLPYRIVKFLGGLAAYYAYRHFVNSA
jgi:glycerol uptake facilitator-like aquaporin